MSDDDASVPTFGLTGHQGLTSQTIELVSNEIERILEPLNDFRGCCSLAEGADQLFADLVLKHQGSLLVIVPCAGYEDTFENMADRKRYEHLLSRADEIRYLDFEEPSEDAFWAAGQAVADASDDLIAVWNGQPAAGLGGTADVVRYAKASGTNVTVVWPPGASRS